MTRAIILHGKGILLQSIEISRLVSGRVAVIILFCLALLLSAGNMLMAVGAGNYLNLEILRRINREQRFEMVDLVDLIEPAGLAWDGVRRAAGRQAALDDDFVKAAQAWQGLPDGRDAYLLHWGEMLLDQERVHESVGWLDKVVAHNPECGDCWFALARAYEGSGRFPAALAAYENAADHPLERTFKSDVYVLQAALILENDIFADDMLVGALEKINEGLAADDFRNPDWQTRAYLLKGNALRRLARNGEALDAYRQVLEEWPDDYWANYYSGQIVWQMEEDVLEAERFLLRSLDIRAGDERALTALEEIYRQAGLSQKLRELEQIR